jgi:hypothetical protein
MEKPTYDVTRLFETLAKSLAFLTMPIGRLAHRCRLPPGIGFRRSHALRARRPRSFARQAGEVLIIGVSFVIGLNFERFTNYAAQVPDRYRLAIYHLSGQADADEKARAVRGERAREREERAEREQGIEAQRAKQGHEVAALHAKQEQARMIRIERSRVVTAAWQEFLTANRAKFKEIELVKDSRYGDYNCLRMRNTLWDFASPYKRDTEIARQKAEVATYQARDSISDDFVRWLNSNRLLDRADWKYEDLQNMDTDFSVGCLSPEQAWRVNRY